MSEDAKRAVGYVRVSVDNERKISPEIQIEAIEAYCRVRGWELFDVVVERGRSAGEGKKRPGFDRCRRMLRRREASALVVYKIDRCSRSVKDFADILSELRGLDADFVSTTETFDTSTPIGRAMLQITMVFAELERERSSERLTAWHDYRRRQGKPVGDAAMPTGYYREKETTDGGVEHAVGPFLVNEETAAAIKGAFAVLIDTGSSRKAQLYLAEHGHPKYLSAVRVLLRSTALAGVRMVDGQPVPGEWPAIIDWDTHLAAVAILDGRRRKRGRPKAPRQLLTGIAVCGQCGRSMLTGSRGGGTGGRRYQCSTIWNAQGDEVGPRCALSIGQEHLEGYVENWVLNRITPQEWKRMRRRRAAVPAAPLVDVATLEAKLAELAEDYAMDRITRPEWDAARDTLMSRRADAEAANEAAVAADHELPDVEDLHREWRAGRLTIEQKRLVITAVADRVVVRPGFLIPGRRNGWAGVEDRTQVVPRGEKLPAIPPVPRGAGRQRGSPARRRAALIRTVSRS